MAKTLQMVFETSEGKKLTLSVDEPVESLTGSEVEQAMQAIIDATIFETEASFLEKPISARVVERTVEELL